MRERCAAGRCGDWITRAAVLVAMLVAAAAAAAATTTTRPAAPADRPWMDSRLSPDQRAHLLLDAMTPDERYGYVGGQCDPQGHTGALAGIPRLGVPTVYFNDGPAGVHAEPPTYVIQGPGGACGTFQIGEVGAGHATALPAPLALAASFDERLAHEYGRVVGDEAARKANQVIFGLDVNIMRDPRGGRTFEAFGEDPYLASRMAVG